LAVAQNDGGKSWLQPNGALADVHLVLAQYQPQLGLLIEGCKVPERRHFKYERALSPAVRDIFNGEPTPRQHEALQLALATPDIFLIQGPPGTGKTRTIAALQTRLAEISDNVEGISGHTLLTSYQHDAVEHVASQTQVFGLPTIKVGKKHRQVEVVDGFDNWRRERINAVRTLLESKPKGALLVILQKVRDLAAGYRLVIGDGDQAAKTVLRKVAEFAQSQLPLPLKDRLSELRQKLERSQIRLPIQNDQARLIKTVRALRTTPEAFAADGAHHAHKTLLRLIKVQPPILTPQEQSLLEQASDWEAAEPPPFLANLKTLQDNLLDRLSLKKKPAASPNIHLEVERLLADIIDALHHNIYQSAVGKDAVLHDYLEALENNIAGTRATVMHYTTTLAATCQQAANLSTFKEERIFDTVIIDEAARANPLDLFIPMSLAAKRIILVGDHRQLPHILEPEIEKQLDNADKQAQVLKNSLFERLFNDMRAREAQDGVKRTITLDAQYRMHPVLGQFVSDTFYKRYNESFESPLPADNFLHHLDGYKNAVAAWIDIPLSRGKESKGMSKSRRVEARWIAKETQRLMTQQPALSFGVITFYTAQKQAILTEMAKLKSPLVELTENGDYEIAEAWRETSTLTERLRVGTVDAFQGKEFDVVILSMTRSNDFPVNHHKALRKKYGHLMLENRLCVAMSRQKRLLIVVGDLGMLQGEAAAKAIPCLLAFRQLCEGEPR
jgi:superfamily I DNA/RNA helicase